MKVSTQVKDIEVTITLTREEATALYWTLDSQRTRDEEHMLASRGVSVEDAVSFIRALEEAIDDALGGEA